MFFRMKNLLQRKPRPLTGGRRRRPCPLQVEHLETRLTPAFNLTISTAATAHVAHNAGTFIANATGANINVADIRADLLAGKNVTISDGNTGAEAGDIAWKAGADLDFNGLGLGGLRLSVAVDSSATGGSLTFGARVFDSNAATPDALTVNLSATRDLTVNGSIADNLGSVTLSADTRADGTGDDGVGTLILGPGSNVTGAAVTLRGADVNLDTSANPATVSAVRQNVTFANIGHLAEGVAVDAQGNIFVANGADATVSKVTPQGQSSVYLSGLTGGPSALAVDAQGNLYVATITDNTIRKVSPDGKTITIFTQQVVKPNGLVFDAAGNLYVSSDVNGAGAGSISKVSPDGKTVTTFVAGLTNPTGLAFDAQGFLYVLDQSQGTISKVSPDGKTVTPFAAGFSNPYQIAFDAQGYLYVSSPGHNAIFKVSPLGQVTTYASGSPSNVPAGLAFDGQGNLFVANFNSTTLTRISPGTVTVRSSLPSRPISVGGADNAVAGVNLTAAQLARITAQDVLTLGDPGQLGDVTIVSTTANSALVRVLQNPTGPGTIVLNDESIFTGLTNNGDILLSAGMGGVRETNATVVAIALDAGGGAVFLNSGGDVGTPARPLAVRAARLGAGAVAGVLDLSDSPGPNPATATLTTTGPIGARFIDLTLAGNFVGHAGDLRAAVIDLVFSGTGTQTFDSGGQGFTDLFVQRDTVRLVNSPLNLGGTLTVGGTFDANALAVSVGGVDIGPGAFLFAPTGTLTDSGDWRNEGGTFVNNNGTVVLNGFNQRVFGSNTFHNLTKVATVADTLTFQAFTAQTIGGLLTLQGAANAPLSLRSSTPGAPWEIDPFGVLLANLSIQDSPSLLSPPGGVYIATPDALYPTDIVVQADLALPTTGVHYAGLVARYSGPGDTNMYWGAIVGFNGKFQADIFRNVNGTWTELASFPVSTGTGTLKFQVVGTSLKLFLNNNLVSFAADGQLTAGGRIGTRTASGDAAANLLTGLAPEVSVGLPFTDNFNTQPDGSQLSPFWSDRLGDATVKNQQIVTAVNDPNSADSFKDLSLSTVNGSNAADVFVQADVVVGNTGVQYSGLLARYSGPGDTNTYWGAIVGINGKFQADIFRNVNGTWTELASVPVAGGTGTLRFEAFGPSLKLFFNGALAAFASDSILTSGMVGLRSSGGITIANFAGGLIQAVPTAVGYFSDFNAQADGEQLSRAWQDRLGDETIKNHQVVSQVIDPNSADPNKSLALATLNGLTAADVMVQADVAVGTTGVSFAGLVARYSGSGDTNMYWGGLVEINGKYQLVIYVNINGVWSELAASDVSTGTGHLSFSVQGSVLTLTYGTTTISAIDTQLTSGTVGIRGSGGVTYDNFGVS